MNENQKIYDLNIQNILEDWRPEDALREIISNALDETILSGSRQKPQIFKDEDGFWHIRDFGRGLQPENFIQNESSEKLSHPGVIGKFGVGLKDAIATLDRNRIDFYILSGDTQYHAEYRTKTGGSNEQTIHIVAQDHLPIEPVEGTEFVIACDDRTIEKAKDMFCQFSSPEVLETTKYGQILKNEKGPARIYFNGLIIAEEKDFIFSYNITKPSAQLKKALNRERRNVGRTAWSSRVQEIISLAKSNEVLGELFEQFISGKTHHNEISYPNVVNCIIEWNEQNGKQARKFIYVSQDEANTHANELTDLKEQENRTFVFVSDRTLEKLEEKNARKNNEGQGVKIPTFSQYNRDKAQRYQPEIIALEDLSDAEREIFALKDTLFSVLPLPEAVKKIEIAEKLYTEEELSQATGLWVPNEQTIYIRRDLLQSPAHFLGTLAHEMVHAKSGYTDVSRLFERELTDVIGLLAAKLAQ